MTTAPETYVNTDGYDAFPVISERVFGVSTNHILESYRLSRKGDTETEEDGDKIKTAAYIFYENNVEFCEVEIIRRTKNNIAPPAVTKKIKFIYPDGTSAEHEINQDENNYLVITDNIQTVNINYYYGSINRADNTEFDSEIPTGFRIAVNDGHYGILALYPISFYLKKGGELEKTTALYILSTYASEY